jgi:putative DNA primase/helicase
MSALDPRTIVSILGGDVTGRNSCNVPGSGHSKTDRSLSITIDPKAPDGFVVHSFSTDHALACKDYVRERLGLGRWESGKGRRLQLRVVDSGPDPAQEERKQWALKIWSQSSDPTGTIVERYLCEHRGLELSADIAGGVVRYHRGLKYAESGYDRYLPGMVCLLRDIVTDEPCGIHRTFLDLETGQKIDRRMLGIAKGAAIKLDAISTKLTIGEGVETVLTARIMGLGPVWALGSSGEVGRFPVMKGLTEIKILQENDPTSRRDVETCARRYLLAGKRVNIITPNVGNDLNDAWRAAK